MKKFTLILGLILFFVSASTFARSSKLRVSTWDNSAIKVIIDNRISNGFTTLFRMDHLRAGTHRIKIIKRAKRGYNMPSITRVIYNGHINIPQSSKVVVNVNRYNQLSIQIIEEYYNEYVSPQYGNYNGNSSCASGIANFQYLKHSLRNASFDSDKLRIAKQAIRHNSISSRQVYEIMQLLDFETSKLKLAKFAYRYTYDRENFYQVNNAFDFSSSIDRLDRFITSQNNY